MTKTLKTLIAALFLLIIGQTAQAQDTAALLNDLRAARAAYPAAMSREQAATYLNDFAYSHEGWGLLKKGSGNSCPLHETYVSCDILIHKGATDETSIHYDVAGQADFDGGNNMAPAFNPVGPCVLGPSSGCSMTNFLPPYVPAGGGPQPPSQPPVGPVVPSDFESAVRSFIEDVRAAIGRLEQAQGQSDARLVSLEESVAVLVSRSVGGGGSLPPIVFPVYKGSLFGVGVTLKPEAK